MTRVGIIECPLGLCVFVIGLSPRGGFPGLSSLLDGKERCCFHSFRHGRSDGRL